MRQGAPTPNNKPQTKIILHQPDSSFLKPNLPLPVKIPRRHFKRLLAHAEKIVDGFGIAFIVVGEETIIFF